MKRCPSCGEENPDRFRLCGFCGTPLDEAQVPAQEIRKTVSIVFCDLKGSTDLGERLDTESLREVLSLYFSEMRACLERHGGRVEKYIGDAVMAVFGIPSAHEDDALRAVRAAVDMRDVLARVNERLEAGWGVRLANRTGVNTGEVVTTAVVDARHHLVAGDAVNVAARLEQAAPTNEILIGEATYRLVKDAVEVERVEPLGLKGKAERVPAYRLLTVARAGGPTRRVHAPMVGREEELGALDRILTEALASRTCRLVTVVGPAGVGKSRLLSEFVERSTGRAGALHGRCLSYGEGVTFWPLAEITHQAAGIADDDSLEEAHRKLAALLGRDHAGQGEGQGILARLSEAIGLSDATFPVAEIFWAARRLLETLARREPLIVVIDDIHWAEQTLIDLIGYLADTATDAPIVLVATARRDLLEEHPEWSEMLGKGAWLTLQPLSEAESAMVAANLLGNAAVPEGVRDRIVAAAEGNPLFVEQVLGMMIDDGLLAQLPEGRWIATSDLGSLQLPPTISALLGARLDRLPGSERTVAERAALIGQVFFRGAVEELCPEPFKREVDPSLGALTVKELIHPDESLFAGEPTFRFAHILIRDAAYHGLLKRTRAELHERFVDWLERLGLERVLEYEEIRGYHLEQAFTILARLGPLDDHGRQVGMRGAQYLASAGRRALARGDMRAAAGLLRRTAALLPPDDPERPFLLVQAGEALTDLGDFVQADSTLEAARAEAASLEDEAVGLTASLALLHLHYVTEAAGGEAAVVREVERVLPRVEALGSQPGLARAWKILTYVHWTACRWQAAGTAARRSMEHAARAGDHRLGAGFVASLATCALYGPTPVPEAIAECEALLTRTEGDGKAEALILRALAQLEAMRGSFDRARSLYRQSRLVLNELGWNVLASLSSLVSAQVEFLAGDPAAAEAELIRDYASLEEMGERNYISTTAGFLAEALYRQGKSQEARHYAQLCRDLAAADDVSSQVLWRSVLGKVLSATGAASEGEALIRRAAELIEATDELDTKGVVLLDLAEVLDGEGRAEEAAAAAAAAAASFRAKGNVVSAALAEARIDRPNGNVAPLVGHEPRPAAPTGR